MFIGIIKELLGTKMAGSNEIIMSNITLIMNMKTVSTSQEELRDVSNNVTLFTSYYIYESWISLSLS